MDWKRVGRVIMDALRPAPHLLDWLQIIALLGIIFGGAAFLAFAEGIVPAIVLIAIAFAFLLFLSAYRLQGRLDEIESRKAMIALRVDPDQGYQRLVINNPNAFAVKRVYVQLASLETIAAKRPDFKMPTLGFRFPWTSWATEGGSLYMDFPAGAEIPVDIVALPPWGSIQQDGEDCFFFVHLAEKKETPVRATFYQTVGEYKLRLQLCSDDLPIGRASVIVEFDESRCLAMRVVSDEGDSQP